MALPMMKKVDDLYWPQQDEKLCAARGDVTDLEKMLPYCTGFRTAVQAGGAVGVWALRLAREFQHVHTFEPKPENWECLVVNTEPVPNITRHNRALSNNIRRTGMTYPKNHENNFGAYYIDGDGDIETITIDSLQLADVDFLQLDIEGEEKKALIGACATIDRCHPVIVLEVKPLYWKGPNWREAVDYLVQAHGYTDALHIRKDVVLTP